MLAANSSNNMKVLPEKLSTQVIKGSSWMLVLRISKRIISLIRLVVLARLLAPADFGIMGIALLMMMILETFSQAGFAKALIQKKEQVESYLNSTWSFLVVRGLALGTLLFFSAPLVAAFFNEPRAENIIRAISLMFYLEGFFNVSVILIERELEFKKYFTFHCLGAVVDFLVALTAALIFRNTWALVLGLLAGQSCKLIVSYLIKPYRPKFAFDLSKIKELFGFGKWILGSNIILFLLNQGDDILVGKLLGAASLGLYQMAYRISNLPATEITHVISQVTFPAYAKIQNNLPKLRRGYLKVLLITCSLSFPIAGFICFLARDLTTVILGEQWLPMVRTMQVLVIWGLLRSLGSCTGPLFNAIGKPKIGTKLQLAKLILLAICIFPLTNAMGIMGTALAVAISALVINPLANYLAIKVLNCTFKEYLIKILFPFLSSGIMLLVLFASKQYLLIQPNIINLVGNLILGSGVYFCCLVFFERLFNYGFYDIIKSVLNR